MGDCQSCLENTKDSITSSTSSIKDILVPSQNSENISSIMSSAPTFGPPKLKPVYHMEINIAAPVIIPNGPYGTRALIQVLDGKFQGYEGFEDFHGEIVAPSADLAMAHADGSGFTLNVNFTMKLHDGNTILGKVTGKSDRDQDNPANARIHSGKSYEVGVDRYKWMNSQVFVGYGRKEGSNIKLDYYQVID
ncbi:hypothetical protein CTEN210_17820 [Chaetoceros tenuissimus]|uniref:Uncharacterized protein n=1 Tax=Chaetoceros tenuissimus TaxID=426638 RepID=A0AAD3DBD8_9STRA|nr:hypothetical protein CTEN210_17820 [Chaetoceros tenuissimus]